MEDLVMFLKIIRLILMGACVFCFVLNKSKRKYSKYGTTFKGVPTYASISVFNDTCCTQNHVQP